MVKGLIGFVSGAATAFMHFLGSGYVDAALRGFIGGAAGYMGTIVVTLIMQRILTRLNNKNKNNKTE